MKHIRTKPYTPRTNGKVGPLYVSHVYDEPDEQRRRLAPSQAAKEALALGLRTAFLD